MIDAKVRITLTKDRDMKGLAAVLGLMMVVALWAISVTASIALPVVLVWAVLHYFSIL